MGVTLQWRDQSYMLTGQGCTTERTHPMSRDGIDEKNGIVDVYKLLPLQGDSVMIVNCGTHFEIRHHHWDTPKVPPVHLTEEDIERLKQGRIVWN